ncbi:MAG: hypothetical protein V4864_22900 [Pseudomonadota bacterium]
MQPIASTTPAVPDFTLAPKASTWKLEDSAVGAFGEMRDRVLSKPFTYMAAAFSLGFVLARVLR